MTFVGYLITLTKDDVKNYCTNIYNHYIDYELAKITLNFYPLGCSMLSKAIIKLFKKIKFKKIFTLLNFIKLIDYIINKCIQGLHRLKSYDVIDGVDVVVFFFEFLIDKYIYQLTEFQMIQKCQFSLRYAALWIRCFSTIKLKKEVHPFFLGMLVFIMFLLIYPPLFYAVMSDIENFNTFDNICHYFESITSPL
uniref:Uncharacterized protein n=1 Tax=Babesia orientalis TaxID=273649 RepID=A0A0M3TGU9_9APIC|nr:hypothetical protein [Babesia orientalis]ALE29353.1 hypothetical protein [Babesia orientalis]